MTEAERLADEWLSECKERALWPPLHKVLQSYGRLVQEAAAKKAVNYDPLEAKAFSDFGAGERLAASRIADNIDAMDLP